MASAPPRPTRAPRGPLGLSQLAVEGKRVLVRVDFNVPLTETGAVADDSRIRAALPTIRHLIEHNARVILCSHFGRPQGKVDARYSLAPAGGVLAGLLEQEVLLTDRPTGDAATRLAQNLRDGQVLLLENLRFNPGEETNNETFARSLAALAEIYVNDAFGAAHRAHASTVGVAAHLNPRAAGLLMAAETKQLGRLLSAPRSGFVAILGGAKVSDKIKVIDQLLTRVDTLIVGGAMACTFLAAQGFDQGDSKVEHTQRKVAQEILQRAALLGVEVLLPQDHRAAATFSKAEPARQIDGATLPEGLMSLDIGPQTQRRYAQAITGAKTIFWNGPMGVFEWPAFAQGTQGVAQAIAESSAFSVVGGGDSVRAIHESGHAQAIDHISTGGGASLEFIELEGRLPGILALQSAPGGGR